MPADKIWWRASPGSNSAGNLCPVLYMTSDKRWDKYRADPRYQAVVKRIGLPAAAGTR